MRASEIFENNFDDADDARDPVEALYAEFKGAHGTRRRELRMQLKQQYGPFVFTLNELQKAWNTTAAEQLMNDLKYSTIITLEDPLEVNGIVHTKAFDNGVPVLKYFSRGVDRYPELSGADYETCTLPAGSTVVCHLENDDCFGFAPGHGFVKFSQDDYPIEELG